MKIIYLILTFAILHINAVERLKEPRYVFTEGFCSQEKCISACDNDPEGFCMSNQNYIFWKWGKCKCYLPPK
uniref:Knot1 domain-containing protein n=1 Tax=Strongyloides papillosus TaxID=174720 RepID=A0A0N5BYZ3_STREA